MTTDSKGNDELMSTVDGPRPRRANQLGLGSIPQLDGVAQIVGLALGSPEFQRR